MSCVQSVAVLEVSQAEERMKHFNELSPAEAERLAILAEEMGEAIQVIGKILRHGYDSCNPHRMGEPRNRHLLEIELGDVMYAIDAMDKAKDITLRLLLKRVNEKEVKIQPYLHHQPIKEALDHIGKSE
jgi:hypothetical protein